MAGCNCRHPYLGHHYGNCSVFEHFHGSPPAKCDDLQCPSLLYLLREAVVKQVDS